MDRQRRRISRRDFLRGVGAGLAVTGLAACAPVATPPAGEAGSAAETAPAAAAPTTLKIIQWSHFVPAYDEWFDGEFTKQWGAENNTEVIVDHIAFSELLARASAEVAAQSGHDLFGFISPPSAFEPEVIDHTDVIEEAENRFGQMHPLARASTYNPKTNKWFGFSDNWVPDPIHWRTDLWEQAEPGSTPDTWEDILRVGRKLKEMGHPLGIGISPDIDSNMALRALMYSYGSSVQDEDANVVINSPETVEAVKMGVALFQEAMEPEVLAWDASSNNRFLLSGRGSLILNAISALRTAEKDDPELARNIGLWSAPAGPVRRIGLEHVMGVYAIWNFSENVEGAKKFLLDLTADYRTAFIKSEFYNFPSFPETVPDLADLVAEDPNADPPDKYAILATAQDWATNVGYPGVASPAIGEVFDTFIIPNMFALAARGEMTPEEAVAWAEGEIVPIFEKWRQQGFI
ncbi:MAG: ABC transporter substrate-binding protein [Litorilinea sp.]|nr:MAG: ABC transporter substrate-binding protein [Litorilinea sp.]